MIFAAYSIFFSYHGSILLFAFSFICIIILLCQKISSRRNRCIFIKKFTICLSEKFVEREIGRGAYSRVFTVERDSRRDWSRSVFAAREIHSFIVEGVGEQQIRENLFKECQHCSVLSHPNIVRFVGISKSTIPLIIMELMADENLYDYITNLPQDGDKYRQGYWKRRIIRCVANGLVYLHEQRPPVIHSDLSPRNILLKIDKYEDPFAKIGDLGVARIIKADSKATQSRLAQVPGSVEFMPPESCGDSPVYGTATDTFSYGCIVLFVTTGKWPTPSVQIEFDPVTKKPIAYSEVERRQRYLDEMQLWRTSLKKTIISCLSNDPSERPTMAAVAEEILMRTIFLKSLNGSTVSVACSSICSLFSHASKRFDIPLHEVRIIYAGGQLDFGGTLECYKIEREATLHIVVRVPGGGRPTDLYSYFDECVMKSQCPFHELFKQGDINVLSQEQENAYKLLCHKFNLSNEIIRAIKDNHEENAIRLADVLHRIYHKDPSITWQRITEMVSSSNAHNCTCM